LPNFPDMRRLGAKCKSLPIFWNAGDTLRQRRRWEQGFAPKLLVTDKLRSYASAFRRLRLTCAHEQVRHLTDTDRSDRVTHAPTLCRQNLERSVSLHGAGVRGGDACFSVFRVRVMLGTPARCT
jgi:hypothetical protein